jgi:hypothetical protein
MISISRMGVGRRDLFDSFILQARSKTPTITFPDIFFSFPRHPLRSLVGMKEVETPVIIIKGSGYHVSILTVWIPPGQHSGSSNGGIGTNYIMRLLSRTLVGP